MRTLDEVIEIVEERKAHYDEVGCFYCHYSNRADCVNGCVLADVLHYMKEYRDLKSTMDWHAQMEEIRNSIENVPFTWEQLKAMEGKPVWVEDGLENGEWYIIECFTDSGRFIAHDRYADDTVFKAIDMGDMWQAYRKEKE